MRPFEMLTEDVPAWYELGAEPGHLVISVHRLAADFIIATAKATIPIVADLQEKLKLPAFIEPTEGKWGFGGVLIAGGSTRPDWVTWRLPLQQVLGPKFGLDYNWGWAYAASATLQVIFLMLTSFDEKTGHNQPQLLTIDSISTRQESYGGALNVTILPPLCRWITQQPHDSQRSEITAAMMAAHQNLCGRIRPYDPLDFRARFSRPKWMHLDVPGNACGLDPASSDGTSARGYKLQPHNTDSPIQQLTLLIGVAALYQLARREGY